MRGTYRSVVELPGEPHVARTELASGTTDAGDRLLRLVHLTDLHVTDTQSPARFEFVNRFAGDPRFRELLTMQRPHETLNPHAVGAMVRTVNALESVDVVAMTGDGVDNAQQNELTNLLALLDGGEVRPDSGDRAYDGVQCVDWPLDIFWKPDGRPDGDLFQRDLGFPRRPGLLEQAMQTFRSDGLRSPWLRCWGNHEQVCQGVGVVTAALAQAMASSRKAVQIPPGIEPDTAVDAFTLHPERFLSGESRPIAADPSRRPITRRDLLAEPYHVHDAGAVRCITLDTVCDAGGADGTIDAAQLDWLEQRLAESRDRYVVVLSHHGYDTLSNPRGERRADQLLRLLKSHDHVVLWLNGHIHANRITPRGSFWEVTTSSLVDWPCQARLVELYRTTSGDVAIRCTMLDHDGEGLAGLHRELAANVPYNGFDSWRPGRPADRNAVLLLPDPLHG